MTLEGRGKKREKPASLCTNWAFWHLLSPQRGKLRSNLQNMIELPKGSETGDKGSGQNQFNVCLTKFTRFSFTEVAGQVMGANLPVKNKVLHKKIFLKNLPKNTSELTK